MGLAVALSWEVWDEGEEDGEDRRDMPLTIHRIDTLVKRHFPGPKERYL